MSLHTQTASPTRAHSTHVHLNDSFISYYLVLVVTQGYNVQCRKKSGPHSVKGGGSEPNFHSFFYLLHLLILP